MKYFISCNNPVKVTTRKGDMYVPCHKCIQCQLTRKSIDTLNIDLESQYNSKYQDFLTLTYDDSCLPYLDFNYLGIQDVGFVDFFSSKGYLESFKFASDATNRMPCVPIRFGNRKKRMFNPRTGKYYLVRDSYYVKPFYSSFYNSYSVKDVVLYNERIKKYFEKYPSRSRGVRQEGVVPILWKEDLQRFLDRLRLYFKRLFGPTAKFKYFAVGEYGTESLRPHWHILLFHSSDAIHGVINACESGNYNKNLSEVWSYGNIYSEATDGHISDYLSGYVNCHSNLPEVLSPYPQRKFKSILFGEVRSLSFVASCLKEKRFRELSTVSVTSKQGVKSDVSVSSALVSRLLPRFTGYDIKDVNSTYETLSCAYTVLQSTDLNIYNDCQLYDFLLYLVNYKFDGSSRLDVALRCLQTYCLDIAHPAYIRDNTLNPLFSVFYAARKLYRLSSLFEMHPFTYLSRVSDYVSWLNYQSLIHHFELLETDFNFAYEYYSSISPVTGIYDLNVLSTRSLFQRQQIDAAMAWDSCIKHKQVADSYND